MLKNLRGFKSLDYLYRLIYDNKNVFKQGSDISKEEALGAFVEDEGESPKPLKSLSIMISEVFLKYLFLREL